MAYDRQDDIPVDYPVRRALTIIQRPEFRELWHLSAEKENFLNLVGHEAVQRSLYVMAGPQDGELGGLGATIYEIVTMREFAQASEVDEPTYHDDRGMVVAMSTAYTMQSFDPFATMEATHEALSALDEETPALSELIAWSAHDILGGDVTPDQLRKIKAGAGLMRALHMTAKMDLLHTDFPDSA